MSTFKKVSEVVKLLGDRGFAEPHVVKVNKGSEQNPRWLDVIEWHEVCAMLDEVFGPFGWDAIPVTSHSDYANGLYTYDIMLVGRAEDDETGEVVELKRPGRGVGLVPRSALNSDSEHDRQAHGAKSDAITNASKALGQGFGLYLYFKKGGSNGGGKSAPRSNGNGNGNGGGNGGGGWSDQPALKDVDSGGLSGKQINFAKTKGLSDDDLATMTRGEVKAVLDGKGSAARKNAATAARTGTPDDYDDI